jgi:hypothetical protein
MAVTEDCGNTSEEDNGGDSETGNGAGGMAFNVEDGSRTFAHGQRNPLGLNQYLDQCKPLEIVNMHILIIETSLEVRSRATEDIM